jgi:hypothetical protein
MIGADGVLILITIVVSPLLLAVLLGVVALLHPNKKVRWGFGIAAALCMLAFLAIIYYLNFVMTISTL